MPNAIAKEPSGHNRRRPASQRPWLFRVFERPEAICLALAILTLAVFGSVLNFGYVDYDDQDYVSNNPHVQTGLSWPNLKWAFTSGHASNWHPLTWLSHQADWQFFGAKPGPQHLMNLVFHLFNTALLFLTLRRMTSAHWRSAVVAVLFAVHPLRAESVAWISERKDELSGLFFLLTLWAYYVYVRNSCNADAGGRRYSALYYLAALSCFACGLMSKPMLVTTPFLLLLLDYWPLERYELKAGQFRKVVRLALEKIPFVVLAALSSGITFLVQRKGGAVSSALPFSDRLANALISYVRYIAKMFWPIDLSVLYPHPGHWPVLWAIGAAVLLLLVSLLSMFQARRRPYLVVGWLWFMGMLVPVIGLVQVGIQSMADRYTYLPGIGLAIMLAWGIAALVQQYPQFKPAVAFVTVGIVAACGGICAHQVQFWRDSQSLFQRAIDATRDNYLAYNNLGYFLAGKGKLAEARTNYEKSIAINPLYSDALNNLGFALAGEGKHSQAIPYYEAALRISPNQPEIRNNLGNALSESGQIGLAIEQYRLALQRQPDHAEAHNNLGIALAMQGHLDEAIEHFRAAIRLKSNYSSAHSNLGNALAARHKMAEATREFEESLRLNPDEPQAHNNLGNVLMEQGQIDPAINEYSAALRLKAVNPEAHFNLAVALLRANRAAEAALHFKEVLRLNPGNSEARRQLDLLSAGK